MVDARITRAIVRGHVILPTLVEIIVVVDVFAVVSTIHKT